MVQAITTTKELRIAVAVALPTDLFKQAQLTGRVQEALRGFEAALLGEVGATFTLDTRVVSVSTKPRASTTRGEVEATPAQIEEAHPNIPF